MPVPINSAFDRSIQFTTPDSIINFTKISVDTMDLDSFLCILDHALEYFARNIAGYKTIYANFFDDVHNCSNLQHISGIIGNINSCGQFLDRDTFVHFRSEMDSIIEPIYLALKK